MSRSRIASVWKFDERKSLLGKGKDLEDLQSGKLARALVSILHVFVVVRSSLFTTELCLIKPEALAATPDFCRH